MLLKPAHSAKGHRFKNVNSPFTSDQSVALSKNKQLLIFCVSLFKSECEIILYIGFTTAFHLKFLDVHSMSAHVDFLYFM